ncbi:MAG TPA: hypothetical protein PK509_09290 [Catalimonadaceae bacterium]|nr:hypothetical protein [Catalimonadaceae bacterium]
MKLFIAPLLFICLIFSCMRKDLVNPSSTFVDKNSGLPGDPGGNIGTINTTGKADGSDYKGHGSYNIAKGELLVKISKNDSILFEFKPQFTDMAEGSYLLQHDFTPGSGKVRVKMKYGSYAEVNAGTSFWSIGQISVNQIANNKLSGTFSAAFNAVDPVTFAPKTLNVSGTFDQVEMK